MDIRRTKLYLNAQIRRKPSQNSKMLIHNETGSWSWMTENDLNNCLRVQSLVWTMEYGYYFSFFPFFFFVPPNELISTTKIYDFLRRISISLSLSLFWGHILLFWIIFARERYMHDALQFTLQIWLPPRPKRLDISIWSRIHGLVQAQFQVWTDESPFKGWTNDLESSRILF